MIKPRLEQWAEVTTFDVPGVGDEPAVEPLDRRVLIDRALLERDSEPFEDLIRDVDAPLLFAKHEDCIGSTEEGFDDAVAAFPHARVVSAPDAPSVSPVFADALHDFCLELFRTGAHPTSQKR